MFTRRYLIIVSYTSYRSCLLFRSCFWFCLFGWDLAMLCCSGWPLISDFSSKDLSFRNSQWTKITPVNQLYLIIVHFNCLCLGLNVYSHSVDLQHLQIWIPSSSCGSKTKTLWDRQPKETGGWSRDIHLLPLVSNI